MLWRHGWHVVPPLRGACTRERPFLWMVLCLAGMTVRTDLLGVTSVVRGLGLSAVCDDRLLDLLHSRALPLETLTPIWSRVVCAQPGLLRVDGRLVLVGDGLTVAKAGKKMPGVKKLHQTSDSKTKPAYIVGHSCQAVAVLLQAASSVFAVPLACRLHEGVVCSNRDQRTRLDQRIQLIDSLRITDPFLFVADAYDATAKVVHGLLATGHHLVTRVKTNAVAYALPPPVHAPRKRGRPRRYGDKLRVASLLAEDDTLTAGPSPLDGETDVTLHDRAVDLLWRPVGLQVRFVAVRHPHRGPILLLSTDLTLVPLEISRL